MDETLDQMIQIKRMHQKNLEHMVILDEFSRYYK